MADPLELAIAELLTYDGTGKRYTEKDAEAFRKAVEEGLCVAFFDEEQGIWTFGTTDAGEEILNAGGSVAGKTRSGARLN